MTNARRRIASNLFELVLMLAVATAVAGMAGYTYGQRVTTERNMLMNPPLFWGELAPLERRYGPDGHHSLGVEEWILRDYFQDARDGVFLDVGAADPIKANNTYFLEARLGWSGAAIDARPEFAPAYRTARSRTRFVSAFISDRSDATVAFYVLPDRPMSSSGDRAFADAWRQSGRIETHLVQTITLNDLLPKLGVRRIDFLSMDIELAEPRALAGFDTSWYRPRLVCIEAHPAVRQAILDYFDDRDYRIVGKYLRADVNNLWFERARPDAP